MIFVPKIVPSLNQKCVKNKSNRRKFQRLRKLKNFWWRWRELNSRPKRETIFFLRILVYFIILQNFLNKQNPILPVD